MRMSHSFIPVGARIRKGLRDQFLVDAHPLNKTSGQPFYIHELEAAIEEALA